MKKPRVKELDFIRAVAILLVVVLHVSAAYMMYSPKESRAFYLGIILNQWSRVCLPLFVFVSGFGLFYRYGKGESIDYLEFYKKRLSCVLLPYGVWSFIYIILRNIFNKTPEFFSLPFKDIIMTYLQWTLWENIHITLWFILMITQLYLLFPLLRRGVMTIKRPLRTLTAHTLVYLILTIYLVSFRINTGVVILDFVQDYYKVNFLGWYYYFILGGIVAFHWDSFREFRWNPRMVLGGYLVTTLGVVMEAYFGYLNYGRPHLETLTSLRWTVLLNSMTALPALALVGRKWMNNEGVYGAFSRISRYSFGIYFVHPQVLTLLKILLGRVWGSYTTRMSYFFVLMTLTFGLSYAFCYVVDKTPLRKILLGISSNRRIYESCNLCRRKTI